MWKIYSYLSLFNIQHLQSCSNMPKNSKQNMASLQNEEQTHILDAIDEMRDLGVNEDISIPQV